MLKRVKDTNRHYKAALEKRKEADKKKNEAKKRKQEMIKEIEEKKILLLVA